MADTFRKTILAITIKGVITHLITVFLKQLEFKAYSKKSKVKNNLSWQQGVDRFIEKIFYRK